MQTNYLCTECENIDELSNFIEPVKDGYYYTATCNKCNNRTHILKEHKKVQVIDKDKQMCDNIRRIPLTLEEFIEQKVPVEHKDKIDEIKDHYITYLVTNKNKHHYGNHEYMHKWLSNEFYQYAKSQH